MLSFMYSIIVMYVDDILSGEKAPDICVRTNISISVDNYTVHYHILVGLSCSCAPNL